jgi:hypothetical protein
MNVKQLIEQLKSLEDQTAEIYLQRSARNILGINKIDDSYEVTIYLDDVGSGSYVREERIKRGAYESN